MAKSKAKTMASASAKTKSRLRKPVRDIKPSKSPRGSFTVRQLQEDDIPSVEPLIEEVSTEEANFQVDKIDQNEQTDFEQVSEPEIAVTSVDEKEEEITPEEEEFIEDYIAPVLKEDLPPKETVKVKFSKFVQLVGNRDFKDVVDNNPDEEIVISSNLLTELAGANDSRGEKRIPLVFLVGIAIGVVLTYILFST